ncbi:unnamed protein product [Moneuplotes crassus]|uniref:Uncharacterized protein n=1 Tax=Euplotes crassus TaxID=5936 RepID=A0AAD1U3E1_EUPCR|nr:unnamed protein product [Moneuplotes crassus]
MKSKRAWSLKDAEADPQPDPSSLKKCPKRVSSKKLSSTSQFCVVKHKLNYSVVPNERIQDKLRLFLKPYNRELSLKKYISPTEESQHSDYHCDSSPRWENQLKKNNWEIKQGKNRGRWKGLSDFGKLHMELGWRRLGIRVQMFGKFRNLLWNKCIYIEICGCLLIAGLLFDESKSCQ